MNLHARNNEVDGLNYFFLSKDEFIKRIENKEFIEWEEVYENTYYGTLISELENSSQKNLIFDIDVVGGLNIKKKFPKQTITIFIKPPSINELETRLINRNLDSNVLQFVKDEGAEVWGGMGFAVDVIDFNGASQIHLKIK